MGNITEILQLLDKEKYSGEELKANYQMLIDKWGEWELFGEDSAGFVIRYVDIGNALFSGLMITYSVSAAISLCIAIIFGKIVFPLLSSMYKNANDEMVDMATLSSANKIEELTNTKMKKKEEAWF